jgi:serine phosphatase RsbU (regulator of sigma subunit)
MKMNLVSNSVGSAAGELAAARRAVMSNTLVLLQTQSRAFRITVLVALFVITAWLDLIVDHNLSLFPLYLIPTLYSAWYLGNRWAYGTCMTSGVVWFANDRSGWYSYHYRIIPYGNLAGRLLVLVAIVAIVTALKNAFEDQYEAEQRVVSKELEIASEVQKRLLPSQPPNCPGLDLSFIYRPARRLSGDYYDFIPLTSERTAIVIGDVSGKGLPSALLMASLQSLVRTNVAMREGKLALFATELNQSLYEETEADRYATLFLATVNVGTLELSYVNAGHTAPLFYRKWTLTKHRQTPEPFEKGGPPLGILSGSQYQCGRILLQEGDVLVLYTDGVLDAANAEQEQFGEERFAEIVRSSLSLSAAEICQRVAERLEAFTGVTPQWDDITLATVKVTSEFSEIVTPAPAMSEFSASSGGD